MKAKKFLMIAACFAAVLLTSCGTHEDTQPDAALHPSSALTENTTPTAPVDTETLLSMTEASKIAQEDAGVRDDELESLHARLNESDSGSEYVVTFATTEKAYEYLVSALSGTILEKSIHTIEADTNLSSLGEISPPAADAQVSTAAQPTPATDAHSTPVPTPTAQTAATPVPTTAAQATATAAPTTAPVATSTPLPTATSAPKATATPLPTAAAPSQTAQITQTAAVEIARKDAGVSESEMRGLKVKLDYEDGIQVYEIDFDAGNMEYEYEIAVSDGTIVSRKSERSDRTSSALPTTSPQLSNITQDAALEIAGKDAGVSKDEMLDLKIKLDYDDGIQVYEIDFDAGNKEYEYKIAALTGEILERDIDTADHVPASSGNGNTAAANEISKDAALAIVQTDTGISENDMLDLKVKVDTDDGIRYYEFEFCHGGYEYEYEIAASDGRIIKKECDGCDHSWHHADQHSTHHSGMY